MRKSIFLKWSYADILFYVNDFGAIFYVHKRSCVFILLRNVKRETRKRSMLCLNEREYIKIDQK